jgi:HPt (histidine-containing phosphotransfer) domain-containing protein
MEPAAPKSAAPHPAPPNLNAALDRLWVRFLPEIRERVAIIESAIQSLTANSLSAEQQEAAASAAHKLAGVLGTFSLQRGTELARELELQFSGTPGIASNLAAQAAELRTIIENRK